jgi:predicted dehydrogenase
VSQQPSRQTDSHRRRFLQRTASLGASLGAAALANWTPETSAGFKANDTLNVACIGTGGRCRHLMRSLVDVPNVRITGVADVYEPHRAEGAKLADSKAAVTGDFRSLLDSKEVDAVLIGAPDHWHAAMTIAACQAGKDVYVEKPLTHGLEEGAAVIAAQNDYKRVVQVGTQQRSMPQFVEARKLIAAGTIGKVHKVHLTWNRNQPRFRRNPQGVDPKQIDWKAFLGSAPDQPFDDYRFRQWRWFWDFGGGIFTDLMVHQIDIANWFLGLETPESAVAIGNHCNAAGVWETPDTVQCLLQYPDDVQVYFEGTFINARNGAMLAFMGTEATITLDRGGMVLTPERNKKLEPREMILGTGPRGADFYDKPDGELLHLANWVDCIRTRSTPACPAEVGVAAANAAHMANRAYRESALISSRKG